MIAVPEQLPAFASGAPCQWLALQTQNVLLHYFRSTKAWYSLVCWFMGTGLLLAQYTGSPVTTYAGSQFSDFMRPDYSCNCGTPVISGSVPVTAFPDCGTDGNYPNAFEVSLEFLGGGSNIDPAALEDKYWMIRFRNLDNLCTVWTYPFAIGDSLYGAVRTGNSIRVAISYAELDPDNTCMTTGFEGYNWDYQVIQICDYPDFDCYRLSTRDTFEMQEVLDMFDVSSNSPYSAYTAPAKVQFGYCETEVYVDMLLGETLSIGNDSMDLHWNDVRSSLQYINICGLDSELIPATENFEIVLRDSSGNAIDQSYFTGLSLESGDFVLMDTVWYESRRCIRLTYKTDGDGSYNRWGIFAAGEAVSCQNAVAVTMDEMQSDDFRLSWEAGQQTGGHRFLIRIYQGGDCTGMHSDTSRNRPNVDNSQVFETVVLASDPRLVKTSEEGNAGNGFVASDGFSVDISALGFLPSGCTCYQAFVYQVCDGMNAVSVSNYWGAALGRTFVDELSCESVEASLWNRPEVCEVIGGSIGFAMQEVICGAYEVTVYLDGAGTRDTFNYYSSGIKNGLAVVSDREFSNPPGNLLEFAHEDTLMHGSYEMIVEMRDTMSPATVRRCTLTTVLELVDLLKPSAVVVLEDFDHGARFFLDEEGAVTGSNPGMVSNNVVNLGELVLPAGACGTDLDFLLDVYDACVVNYEKLEVSVIGINGNVSGQVWQGSADTMRTAVVQLGSGPFIFDFLIKDGGTADSWNRLRFSGTVIDQSAPVVRVPGNTVYSVGSCSDTTSVYVQLSATDACEGNLLMDATHVSGDLAFTALGNGLFRASGISAGAYEVVVSGVSDGSGNRAAEQRFVIRVQSGGVAADRQIVGAGDLRIAVPACSNVSDVGFDLFVVDGCAPNASFDEVRAGNFTVEGDLSGSRFRIRNAGVGQQIVVEARSGDARYDFVVELVPLLNSAAPEVTLSGDLSFQLPVCSLSGEEVTFGIQVSDDCDDLDNLLLNTRFSLGEEEIYPLDYSYGGRSLNFEFRRQISKADHNTLFSVLVTDNDDNTTIRSYPVSVWQEAASDDYSCGDQFNVLLGADCRTEIVASMVLKGDEGAICNEGLQVVIEKKDEKGAFEGYYTLNEVIETGVFKYAVLPAGSAFLRYSNNRLVGVDRDAIVCWGTLLVEDKTPPTSVCPPSVYEGLSPVAYNYYTGFLSEDRSFYPQVFSCYRSNGLEYPGYWYPNELHYYDTWTFRPSKDGIYTLSLRSDLDVMMALFQQEGADFRSGDLEPDPDGWFDPTSPCRNIVSFGRSTFGVGGDAGLGNETNTATGDWQVLDANPVQRLSLPLRKDKEYTLMVTTASANAGGSYELIVTGEDRERDLELVLLGEKGLEQADLSILEYWDPGVDEWDNEVPNWTAYPIAIGVEQLPLYCANLSELQIAPTEVHCYTVEGASAEGIEALVPGNVTIAGSLAAKLYRTGFPEVRDNCGKVEVCVADVVQEQGDCGGAYLIRTFTIRDAYGNVGIPCEQRIHFSVPSISNLVLPQFTQYLECDEGYPVDGKGNPHPLATGYPFVQSAFGYHDLAQEWCNLGAVYADQTITGDCSEQVNIRRSWTILDWCRPGNSVVYNQLINVGDYTGPELLGFSVDTLVYSVSPFACAADFALPRPEARDNCAGQIEMGVKVEVLEELKLYDAFGNAVGTTPTWQTVREGVPGSFVRGLPPGGDYRLRYKATDPCGNTGELLVPFRVVDLMAPVIACVDTLTVSLGGGSYDLDNSLYAGGYARIDKSDLQEGIIDHCGSVDYVVRRALDATCAGKENVDPLTGKTPWGDEVSFYCCDLGQVVEVDIQATDAAGNTSTCVLYVRVEDKVRPVCTAPQDFEGLCTILPADFRLPEDMSGYAALAAGEKQQLHKQLDALFGAAEGTDNCQVPMYEQELISLDWHCGMGSFTRRFWFRDAYGNVAEEFCTQVVRITGEHRYRFRFPADETVDCPASPEAAELQMESSGCDLLSVSTHEERFEANGEACYQVFRTWEVVNWCQFGGDDLSLANPFVVSRDEDGNGVAGDRDVWVFFGHKEVNNIESPYTILAGTDNREYRISDYQSGYYRYTQVLSVVDDDAPTLVLDVEESYWSVDADCQAAVSVGVELQEFCSTDGLSVDIYYWPFGKKEDRVRVEDYELITTPGGAKATAVFRAPIGVHRVEVRGKDGCGNDTVAEARLEIKDGKAPAAIGKNAIVVALMPVDTDGDGRVDGGRMRVWARDYLVRESEDCSGPVRYSIHVFRSGLDSLPHADELDANQESVELSCADADQTLPVIIAAWDAAGNVGYFETYLIVQDNQNVCGTGAEGLSVSGLIATEASNPVEDVEVTLSGAAYEKLRSGTDGNYGFEGLEEGRDYTIIPFLNGDYTNGVTTYDLIEIGKHILNVKPLDSPYKLIAADVDNSRSITTLDLVKLRRLILHVDVRLSNNASWRFVDAGFRFPDPQNPWATDFPELLNLNNLEGGEAMGDFIGVKIGDVTLDAAANRLMSGPRSVSGVLGIEVAELALRSGQAYEIPIYVRDLSGISGYQFALAIDRSGVEVSDITYGVAVSDNFGLRYAGEGILTTSWNGSSPGGKLFGLKLRALKDINLSEVLSLSPRYTPAEAYQESGERLGLSLNFSDGVGSNGYVLYQNKPNPFSGATEIGFYLPVPGEVELTIREVSGKVLQVIRGTYPKGYQSIAVSGSDLAGGVLYYTLETGGFTATRKMILIR